MLRWSRGGWYSQQSTGVFQTRRAPFAEAPLSPTRRRTAGGARGRGDHDGLGSRRDVPGRVWRVWSPAVRTLASLVAGQRPGAAADATRRHAPQARRPAEPITPPWYLTAALRLPPGFLGCAGRLRRAGREAAVGKPRARRDASMRPLAPGWPPGSPAASQAAAQCLGGAPSVPGLCEVWHVREPRRCRARPWRQHQAAPMHGSSGSVCKMKELRDMIEEPQTRLQFSFYRPACARCFGAAAMPGKPPRRVA